MYDHLVCVFGCLVALLCLLQVADATYCPPPPPMEHGRHNAGRQQLRVGYVVLYSCDAGYRQEGEGKITCAYSGNQRSAYWTGYLPKCRRKTQLAPAA